MLKEPRCFFKIGSYNEKTLRVEEADQVDARQVQVYSVVNCVNLSYLGMDNESIFNDDINAKQLKTDVFIRKCSFSPLKLTLCVQKRNRDYRRWAKTTEGIENLYFHGLADGMRKPVSAAFSFNKRTPLSSETSLPKTSRRERGPSPFTPSSRVISTKSPP